MNIIEIFLHLDKYLAQIISQYGTLTYVLLFLVIFAETGFVVTPFLPGDSLLFAGGALTSSTHSLNIYLLYFLLLTAAIVGDTVNYWVGHYIGPVVFEKDHKLIKRKYLIQTQEFFAKHGGKAIVLARFVPIVRTFAPFVAGVARMDYKYFITYNVVGGFAWVSLFTWGGYFFGNLPFVQKNFHYVVIAIIFISIIPIIYEFIKAKREKNKSS